MIFMKTWRALRLWPAALILLALSTGCVSATAQTRSDPRLVAELRKMYSDVVAESRKMFSDDEVEARYFLNWFDLNGDGTPEAIVHVVGPHLCGTGGCNTHIFARHGGGYRLVSTIEVSRPPIIASPRRAHGWRNLIVFVAGGGILRGYYAELQFNGKTYPDGPGKKVKGEPRGMVLIKDYKFYTEGRPLIPPK